MFGPVRGRVSLWVALGMLVSLSAACGEKASSQRGCEPGTYRSDAAATCEACPEGSFCLGADAQPVAFSAPCTEGQYNEQVATPAQDRVCSWLTVCKTGEADALFVEEDGSGLKDRVCCLEVADDLIVSEKGGWPNLADAECFVTTGTLTLEGLPTKPSKPLLGASEIEVSGAYTGKDLTALESILHIGDLILEAWSLESLEGLESVETLSLYLDTPELLNLDALKNVQNMSSLFIENAPKLRLTNLFPTLKTLDIFQLSHADGPHQQTLSGFGELTELFRFRIEDSASLERVEGFDRVESVDTLQLKNLPKLEVLPSFSKLQSALSIEIRQVGLSALEGWNTLEEVLWFQIEDCPNLERIDGWNGFETARKIDLNTLPKLAQLQGFSSLQRVNELVLRDLERLPEVEAFSALEDVDLLEVVSLPAATRLLGFRALKRVIGLQVSKLELLASFDDFSSLLPPGDDLEGLMLITFLDTPLLTCEMMEAWLLPDFDLPNVQYTLVPSTENEDEFCSSLF